MTTPDAIVCPFCGGPGEYTVLSGGTEAWCPKCESEFMLQPTASLIDLVGLDPDFTGGLDATEYVARQNCDHGDIRAKTADQFRAALLDGLDQLPRDDTYGTLVRPGDVADLVHRVAAEVGRG